MSNEMKFSGVCLRKASHLFMAAIVVLGFSSLAAEAASISWSGPRDNATQLPINNGSVIEAVNVGSATSVVINGITFDAGDGASADVDNSDVLVSLGAGDSGGGAPAGASTDFATVLDSHRWATAGGGGAASVEFSGLTIGTAYSVQLSMADVRGCCGARDYVFSDGEAAPSQSASFTRAENVSFIGNFVADAATQVVDIIGGPNSADPGLSYYVLSEGETIPEPATISLIGLGLVGLSAVSRRRK